MDGRPVYLLYPLVDLVLAAALLSGGCAPARTAAEEEAIALVERLGGKVKYDDARSGRPVVEVALGGTKVGDADLAHLAAFRQLQTLSLFDTSVGDGGMQQLASHTKIHTLYLGRTRITDVGLRHLADAQASGPRSLQTLGLSDTAISDASIDLIAGLNTLKSVNLRHTRITAGGVARLQQLRPELVVH